eukprot:TRINITY_DN1032_c0_g1_i4.p1 TRINITY_DN1032_c0_g1~~TRINITY_DN1032_c0_g1_i4.p1  ORF type:complete len:213 (+),score=20.33 TRINITY_DN1032_c0_g1_i4:428-1066(+)
MLPPDISVHRPHGTSWKDFVIENVRNQRGFLDQDNPRRGYILTLHGCALAYSFTSFDITWVDTAQYWTVEQQDPQLLFSHCMRLRSVCWLWMAGVCPRVPSGSYQVALRLRVDPYSNLDNPAIHFRPEKAGDGTAAQFELSTQTLRAGPVNRFHHFFLGSLTVFSTTDYRVEVDKRTNSWKSGVTFDSVLFVPTSALRASSASPSSSSWWPW